MCWSWVLNWFNEIRYVNRLPITISQFCSKVPTMVGPNSLPVKANYMGLLSAVIVLFCVTWMDVDNTSPYVLYLSIHRSGLWGFLWWAPLAKKKDHHEVSSGWSSVWHCSNTGLSSTQYEQIPLGFGHFGWFPSFFSPCGCGDLSVTVRLGSRISPHHHRVVVEVHWRGAQGWRSISWVVATFNHVGGSFNLLMAATGDVWIIPSFRIWGYVLHVEHISCVITNCAIVANISEPSLLFSQ